MTARDWIAVVLVGVLVTACSNGEAPPPTAPKPSALASSGTPSTATPSAAAAPRPTTFGQRIRAVQRDRTPEAQDIIALAKSPTVWQVSRNRVLVGYTLPPPVDWPAACGTPAAWQVLDRRGRVLGEWAQQADYSYVPAGRYFVGLQPSYSTEPEPFGDARRALLVRRGTPTRLTLGPSSTTSSRADSPISWRKRGS